MKTMRFVFVFMLCVIILSACGTNNEPNNGEGQIFQTPYTNIKLPADYDGNVKCSVSGEDPYTVEAIMIEDDSVLFSLVFDGDGDRYLGTMETALGTIDIFADVPNIDQSDKNYKTKSSYQKEIDLIIDYWKSVGGFEVLENK